VSDGLAWAARSLGRSGVARERWKTGPDAAQHAGRFARDLARFEPPPGDLPSLAVTVAQHVFDGVGRPHRDAQFRSHIEPVQNDDERAKSPAQIIDFAEEPLA